jgi:hypothetical protein
LREGGTWGVLVEEAYLGGRKVAGCVNDLVGCWDFDSWGLCRLKRV